MSYNELMTLIDACVNRNGVHAITGRVMNGVLKAMVRQLGAGYALGGVAHLADDPGTPDAPICYFASEEGTYTNFGGLTIAAGEFALFCFDLNDGWSKETIYEGITEIHASIDDQVGTPEVDVAYQNGILSFDFRNMKGNTGDSAGFGTVAATVDNTIGTPAVSVSASGPDTAKNFTFAFTGLKGATGVTSAVVTVDNTSGTPQCAVSLVGQELHLDFTGLKGAQGDTGVSADYPITVVNNLTTNDPTSALSAAQGVQLESEISQLDLKATPLLSTGVKTKSVDASSLGVRNFYINGDTGKYTTNNTYKHSIFPVKPGQVVRVTANADNACGVSFFRSDAAPVSGGTPDYSSAYASIYRVSVAANTYQDFVVPSDAYWCYVYRGSSSTTPKYQSTPSAIAIEVSTLDPDGTLKDVVATDAASVNLVSDAVFNGADYNAETIDLSAVPSQSLSIDGNNAFESTGTHGMIEVEPDDVIKVTGGGGRVAFVSGIYCPNDGLSVGAIETMTLESGKVYFLRVPSNGQGFIYNTDENGTSVSPSAIVRYTPAERIDGTLRSMSAFRFSVSSGALVYVAYAQNRNALVKVKAGRIYVLEFISDAQTQSLYFIEDLPYVGLSATLVSFTMNTNYVNKKLSLTLSPSSDGYYLFRFNKSGGPTYTVNAYDVTDVQNPVADVLPDNVSKFWRYDVYALTKRNYAIADNGCYASSTSYKHCLIPVTAGQYVKVAKGTNNARLAWYTEADTPAAYGVPPYVPGTSVFYTEGGVFKVPDGAKYLFVYASSGSAYASFPSYLAVSLDYAGMPDIVRENGYEKCRRVMFQMGSTTRAENDATYKPLVLLHYSDIHGSTICQDRINDFRNYFKDYINDTIQTGDLVESYWGSNSAFGDESDPDNPCKDILCVIGNHDTASKSGNTFYWHTYQGKQSYDRYFAPWIANWNVVQPADAEENGYCFYYKDYTDAKVRLVVLDTFDTDDSYQATQLAWFESVLADAITNGLSVIIASHFRIKCESLLKSPFTMPGAATENPDSSVCNDPFIPLVKAFIDGGGELVCWITGHSHYDAISKTSEANGSQINICIGNAGRFYTVDNVLWETNSRINVEPNDWKTFDLFNIMAVDVTYKTIVLFRVGSNWDKMGRRVETCCIKYNTGEILYP